MFGNSFQESCWFWGDGLSDSDYTAKLPEPALTLQIKGWGWEWELERWLGT